MGHRDELGDHPAKREPDQDDLSSLGVQVDQSADIVGKVVKRERACWNRCQPVAAKIDCNRLEVSAEIGGHLVPASSAQPDRVNKNQRPSSASHDRVKIRHARHA
jgi:hypothetical protein